MKLGVQYAIRNMLKYVYMLNKYMNDHKLGNCVAHPEPETGTGSAYHRPDMQSVIFLRFGVLTRSRTVYVRWSWELEVFFSTSIFSLLTGLPSVRLLGTEPMPTSLRQCGGIGRLFTRDARSRISSASEIRPLAINHTRDSGIVLKMEWEYYLSYRTT